ncbi:hypothetical protein FE257_003718 [Aspergillus nanangensis]|uniref:Uncharacterized protein n=1 Tax=Aspergillus nanangensis TaxID=2582783 RepID=A0AAD4CS35_ASPNN|nr:hypothetical protein FE257_003718 [Aspergillus nanangensis]
MQPAKVELRSRSGLFYLWTLFTGRKDAKKRQVVPHVVVDIGNVTNSVPHAEGANEPIATGNAEEEPSCISDCNEHDDESQGHVSLATVAGSEMSDGANSAPEPLSPCVIDNTLGNLLFQIFQTPGEESAFAYFFKRASACMPAYDGSQNPYRKLALVSISYPVLLQGILSVSTAHMYNFGLSNDRLLSSRQSRALKSLRLALNDLQVSDNQNEVTKNGSQSPSASNGVFSILSAREIALAAIMMQTSSVLMTGIGDVEVHMKCALHFVQKMGYLHKPAQSIFAKLLVNRFAMVDVVLAHLRFQRPMAPLNFFLYQPNEQLDHEEPSFREVYGCPQPVLCFLARISTLSADLVESSRPQSQIQHDGYILETEMRSWGHGYYDTMIKTSTEPETGAPPPSSPRWNERTDLDTVCECYYWTALLLLMRRVFMDSTETTRVQIIRRHLFCLMDKLTAGCGPDSSLPFPFYMAAREALTPGEREWVRQKHVAMMEVYGDRSREYLMASTEIIWANATKTRGLGGEDMNIPKASHERFIRSVDREASYFMF